MALLGRDSCCCWFGGRCAAAAFRISSFFVLLLEAFLLGHPGEDVGDEPVNRLLVVLD
jgi:hypothetical protein